MTGKDTHCLALCLQTRCYNTGLCSLIFDTWQPFLLLPDTWFLKFPFWVIMEPKLSALLQMLFYLQHTWRKQCYGNRWRYQVANTATAININSDQKLPKKKSESVSCSAVSDFATPWTVAHQATVHGILQTSILEWVAISFSRGIFPTQGLKLGLLNWRQILYCLSHQLQNLDLYATAHTGSQPGRTFTETSPLKPTLRK